MLTDTCPMPFGQKYRGVAMQDVPVTYLHWIWENVGDGTWQVAEVKEYIKNNLDALKLENKDLIWSRKL